MMSKPTFASRTLQCVTVIFALTVSAFADEADTVRATVDGFHEALSRGDGAAAMKHLAPDAIIMEGGGIETRAEYESHHLAADMEFAKAIPSTRSNVAVQVNGDTAWLTSASRTEGTFKEKPVNSRGAELMVLAKTSEGWRIRAIHWSSQRVNKPN